ncbi:MAG: PEGA domain-containing protein, partial [Bryobacteraceae bacterium]
NTTLPDEVEPVLRRALAKSPEQRYATCSEFVAALATACAAKRDWMPLPRGASQNLPTVSASTVDAIPLPPPKAPERRTEPKPAPMIAPAPPADARVPPPRQPKRLDENESTSPVRNVLVALVVILLAALVLFAARRWFAYREEAMATPPPQQQAQTKPAQTPPQPAQQTPAPQTPGPGTQPADKPSAATPSTTPTPTPPPEQTQPAQPAETAPAKPATQEQPASRPAQTPKQSAPSTGASPVNFTSYPSGAQLVFDNDPALSCTAPCTLPLLAGRHTLAASLNGYRSSLKIFEVPGDSGVTVALQQVAGTLSIATQPSGATVVFDGKEQAQKTPATISLPAGRHQVQLIKGTLKHEETVEIRDGHISVVNIEWTQ